jgi:hypothetical protein
MGFPAPRALSPGNDPVFTTTLSFSNRLLLKTTLSFLSSRAQPRDLQF